MPIEPLSGSAPDQLSVALRIQVLCVVASFYLYTVCICISFCTIKIIFLCNISSTRRCVSTDIQTLKSRLKKRGAAEFFKRLRDVWISNETHFRVFDMTSQMINNSIRGVKAKVGKMLW